MKEGKRNFKIILNEGKNKPTPPPLLNYYIRKCENKIENKT